MSWRRLAWALTACAAVSAAAFVLLEPAPASVADERAGGVEQSIGFFDPHLHLALVESRSLGPSQWLVTLRASSDAARIEIELGRMGIEAFDATGHRYAPRVLPGSDGQESFEARLQGVLRGGDSVTQSFLFDLPADAALPRLDVGCSDGPGRWLPRSWVHRLGECAVFELS